MPLGPLVIAVFMALTISFTLEFSDPVNWYEQPSSLQASSAPYFVGTKNGLVVTWLTSTYFCLELTANPSPPPAWADAVAVPFEGLPPPPPHADSRDAASPAAPPVRAARRVSARKRVA